MIVHFLWYGSFFFQTVGEDVVKFVVDRRPSKTLLADMHLWNVSETAAANLAPDTEHQEDDVNVGNHVEVDDKQHKRSKKRQHSNDIQDDRVEFSAAEMKITSPLMSSSYTGSTRKEDLVSTGNGKMKRRKKGEHKEYSKNVDAKVAEDSDHEPVTKTHPERKKHKSLKDENSQRADGETDGNIESGNFAHISGSEFPRSVDTPHRARKKRVKNRHEVSLDATADERTAGTVGRDSGTEQAAAPDASVKTSATGGDIHDAEVIQSPSGPSSEFQREAFKLRCSAPSTPSRGESGKVLSPGCAYKASCIKNASEETIVDSPPTSSHSPPSSLDPVVALDSAVAKKSPRKTGRSNVQQLNSPSDVSAARPLTETPTSAPVCYRWL